MLQYIVLAGASAQLIGILFYARETVRGETKPNRVTWLMWSIAPLIASVAAFSDGVRWAALPVFMAGFAPLLVFFVSFMNPKSYWKLEVFDYICGTFSILALILWGITEEPLFAIIFSIISDGFAALPTIIKSWKHPETESVAAYTTGFFNALTSFFALRTFGVSELAFPIYLVLIDSLLAGIIYKRRLKNKNMKTIRKAARTVIVDESGEKVAVLEVRGGEYHKIPGGGIEEGESAEEAAIREALEEGGCDVRLMEKIGESDFVEPSDPNRIHHSICFLAQKVGNQKIPQLNADELERKYRLMWLSFDEAIKLFENVRSEVSYELEMNDRDLEFVRKAKAYLDR